MNKASSETTGAGTKTSSRGKYSSSERGKKEKELLVFTISF